MATQPLISLQGRVTDAGAALAQGQATGERFRTQGVREQILNQTAQQNEMTLEQQQRTNTLKGITHGSNVLKGILSVPVVNRPALIAQNLELWASMGIPVEEFTSIDLTNDQAISDKINSFGMMSKAADGKDFTLKEGDIRFDAAGNPIASNVPEGGSENDGFTNINTDKNTGVTTGLSKRSGQIEVIPASPGAVTALEEQAQSNISAQQQQKKIDEQSVVFTQSGSLRKEFEANTKESAATIEAFEGMQSILTADEQVLAEFAENFEALADEDVNLEAILNDSRAISDIALIFSFFKTVDPTSTVREGEFATVENAGSLWTRWGNTFNKLLKGERMNDNQRNQIIRISQNKRNQAAKQFNKQREKFGSLASRQSLDPSLVITGEPVEEGVDFTSVTNLPGGVATSTVVTPIVPLSVDLQAEADAFITQSLGAN